MSSVLFVRLSAMGDLMQSLGAVRALRVARPDWKVTFVTQQAFAPLLEGAPGVDRVVAFDRRGGLPAVLALRRALRGERFDFVVDLQGNWKSAFVARLASAATRVGMAAPWRQEPRSRWLLDRVVACEAIPHPARAAWELVRHLAPDAPYLLPRLEPSAEELARERAAVRALGVDPDLPLRLVVVTDAADPRALRPAQVAELATGPGQVLAALGPAEASLQVPEGLRAVRHGPGEVRRLVALGRLVAAAGGEVVGPDQGATHVLAAAGAPTRVVYGSQDPRRTAPPGATAVVGPSPPPCQPCRARRCVHPEGVVCMQFAVAAARQVATQLPESVEDRATEAGR